MSSCRSPQAPPLGVGAEALAHGGSNGSHDSDSSLVVAGIVPGAWQRLACPQVLQGHLQTECVPPGKGVPRDAPPAQGAAPQSSGRTAAAAGIQPNHAAPRRVKNRLPRAVGPPVRCRGKSRCFRTGIFGRVPEERPGPARPSDDEGCRGKAQRDYLPSAPLPEGCHTGPQAAYPRFRPHLALTVGLCAKCGRKEDGADLASTPSLLARNGRDDWI